MKAKPRQYRGMKVGTEEWVEGNLINAAFFRSDSKEPICYIFNNDEDIDCFEDMNEWNCYHEVDLSTVGQSTGETDKTEAPLWEDDAVIDHYDQRWVIVWCRGGFRAKNMETKCMWALDGSKVTKVGTIYDSPSVLYKDAPARSGFHGNDDEE